MKTMLADKDLGGCFGGRATLNIACIDRSLPKAKHFHFSIQCAKLLYENEKRMIVVYDRSCLSTVSALWIT